MSMNRQVKHELDELLYLTLENVASPNQIESLNTLIESSLEIQQYADDYYFVVAALGEINAASLVSRGSSGEVKECH